MNFYPAPPEHIAEIFCTIPESLRCTGQQTDWRGGSNPASLSIFLEGPTTDAQGNLYIVDVPFGRILKIDSITKRIDVEAQWDGEPNGLAITHDGYMLVTDYKRGLLLFDPKTKQVLPYLPRRNLECWKGINDLVVDSKGCVYFTDQGQTGMSDPTGAAYRLHPDGKLDCLLDNGVSPNGIVLSPDEKWLYVAMTRSNAVWRMPVHPDGTTTKANLFFQSFGNSGPDGLTIDAEGNLFICHPSLATVFVVDKHGLPVCRIKGRGSGLVTNIIFGGPKNDILFFTDSLNGHVFSYQWHCPGGTPTRASRATTTPFKDAGLSELSVDQPARRAEIKVPHAQPMNRDLTSPKTSFVPQSATQTNGHAANGTTANGHVNGHSNGLANGFAKGKLPYKVYAPDNFHPGGIERARELFETVVAMGDDGVHDWPQHADGLMSRAIPITGDQIRSASKLRAISKQGVGVDTLDIDAAKECGITVVNTPGINASAVAELVYGMVISLKRRITEADRRMRSGEQLIATKCMGSGLSGKTVGIVGMGNIGKATARLFLLASDCQLIAYDPFAPKDAWADLKHTRVADLNDMLADVDVLSLHLPLTPKTRGLISKAEIEQMRTGAVIVNGSRGGIVDEADLFDALKSGRIAGAALDALEHEPASKDQYGETLYTLPNVVLTPHLGAATSEVQELSARAVAEQLALVLSGAPESQFSRIV
ncbi:hypothetical protein EX895_005788 [Sporisorium graminicola]|uniref:Phosphoglycerate dehydrogenase n=1 Tax=Sporisorium graminicola TaxID=280036 RepID=A0A4U7KNQ0_9BASI|nr:hypothetical protein EX895_005788 [Sporisorium graminicola]TKY84708.1 hypothetical protein EX895_005788 [Sporisorium graminicola]